MSLLLKFCDELIVPGTLSFASEAWPFEPLIPLESLLFFGDLELFTFTLAQLLRTSLLLPLVHLNDLGAFEDL
jgi:hypothetical protein